MFVFGITSSDSTEKQTKSSKVWSILFHARHPGTTRMKFWQGYMLVGLGSIRILTTITKLVHLATAG